MALASRLRSTSHWSDPRVKPPFGAVEVDWGHRLARGLRGYWLFNEGAGGIVDLVHHVGSTPTGTPVWAPTAEGVAVTFDGVSEFNPKAGARYVPTGDMTALIRYRTGSSLGQLICDIRDQSVFKGWMFGASQTVSDRLEFFTNVQGWKATSTTLVYNRFHTYGITALGTAGMHYLNGVSDGAFVYAPADAPAEFEPRIGRSANGTLVSLMIAAYAHSANDMMWLNAEPYSAFRPILRRRYFIPPMIVAAGGAAAGRAGFQRYDARYIRFRHHIINESEEMITSGD